MISIHFQGKPFNITVIQDYAPSSNAEEAEQFYEDLEDLLELIRKKRCSFHQRGQECKSQKSRDTQSIGKFGLGVYWKTANTLFQQHKRLLYTWTSLDGHYQNQTDDILCSQQWRLSVQSAKIKLEADCDSDHELLIAKFRLKLKKVGKTSRPFRHDLNQIPYNYAVEVTNRFQGLDIIECLKIYGQRFITLYRKW